MSVRSIAGAALLGTLAAAPLAAQEVEGDIALRSGPVAARVTVRPDDRYHRYPPAYRTPPRRIVVVERYAPRVIVVERVHVRDHKHWKHRKHRWHGYQPIHVYYDGRRYYDRWFDRPGIRQIVIYERDGRFYYDDCDDDRGRWDDRRDYDRDDDRYDRDRGRYDDYERRREWRDDD